MSERFKKGRHTFGADQLGVRTRGDTLELLVGEGDDQEAAYLTVAQVRELVAYLNKVLPEASGPTERERIEMCGADPVRNSDLGL